jgi:hypothetical protein
MRVHIHDNNKLPANNCMTHVELEPGKILTLHLHPGECQVCPEGHCHHGSIGVLLVEGELFVVFEGAKPPEKITLDDFRPRVPISHRVDLPVEVEWPKEIEERK